MLNNMGLGVACSVWGFLRLAGFGVASAGGVRACGCVCCWLLGLGVRFWRLRFAVFAGLVAGFGGLVFLYAFKEP